MIQPTAFLLWGAIGSSCVIIALLVSFILSSCSLPQIARAEMIAADTVEFVEEEVVKVEG